MRLTSSLLAAVVALASAPHPPPAHPGVVTVEIDPSWSYDERRAIGEALEALAVTGERWVAVTSGGDVSVHRATFKRCRFDGLYDPGTRRVLVDPGCCPGPGPLRSAVQHELLHHRLGDRHICRFDGEAPNCIAGLRGPAVMNPHLLYGGRDFTERPTALDLQAHRILLSDGR